MSAARVCRTARIVLGVDGAVLSAVSGHGDPVTLAHSGRLAARVAQLQWTTGTGPNLDAYTTHRPALGPDLDGDTAQARWPGFAAAAAELGVRAVFAFPLLAGAACCGTLQLHCATPGALTPTQLRDALRLADTGLAALLDTRAGIHRRPDEPAEPFGDGQDEIFQASGVISVQLDIGVDEALVRLRAHAYAHNQPLDHTAADVMTHRLRFTPTPDRPG